MIAYKLTTKTMQTHGGCQWAVGETRTAPGGEPCTCRVIHWYSDPLLAVLHDPIHGQFGPMARLWECEVEQTGTDGLKCWGTRCTLLREIPLPTVTAEQRVRYAILCAREVVPKNFAWRIWADRWLSGADRSAESAHRARWLHWADVPPDMVPANYAAWAAALTCNKRLCDDNAAMAACATCALWPFDLAAIAAKAMKGDVE